MAHRNFSRSIVQRQKGAVAIEFVFIFPVFFLICYAIVAFGLAFMLVQNFTYASEEVLRAALACEDCETPAEWEAEIIRIGDIRLTKGNADSLLTYSPSSLNVIYSCYDAAAPVGGGPALEGTLCAVTVTATPLLEGITMPGFGKIPRVPNPLSGKASLLF